jgi:hypothetical protein
MSRCTLARLAWNAAGALLPFVIAQAGREQFGLHGAYYGLAAWLLGGAFIWAWFLLPRTHD